MIDSHCHLAGEEFVADLLEVVARARAVGLSRALVILAADDAPELQRADAVLAAWPEARFSIGVHPHAAARYSADPSGAARVVAAALDAQPQARGLGEIGLDYHYDFAPRDVQQAVFREQLRLAARRQLPVVIHTREADDDTLRILAEERIARGVFHCFTGDRAFARKALDLGFHLSLSGIVTFPKAEELRAVAQMVPIERLLIETDSPFLAPVPHRGKRNEPEHFARVADAVAGARGVGRDAIVRATTDNFGALFSP